MTQQHPATDPSDALVTQLIENLQIHKNRDVIRHLVATSVSMATSNFDRLNLKIASDALRELSNAFKVFEPYQSKRKVTLFGSARTSPLDPTYLVARDVSHRLAEQGWMTITGAGQGIMQAGIEGAGPEMSFGINIRLPFEQGANHVIADDPKLVQMKYFFTRKLMLVKESDGFVIMPGGFGTLDETFELLTLIQTGKALPAPVVLLNSENGTYWQQWEAFLRDEVISRGLVSPPDQSLYLITNDTGRAVDEILGFYRNYHSIRYVNDRLVIRTQNAISDDHLAKLNTDFQDLCQHGTIERCGPSKEEVSDDDGITFHRIGFHFNKLSHGRLRTLINAINDLPSETFSSA